MATTNENKVEFGLKNSHYAIVTDDGNKYTYEKPVALKGSTELSSDPEGDSNAFYADDSDYYDSVSNQGYSGKLTLARVTDQFMQDVFGEVKDTATGIQMDNTDAQPKKIALLFEFDGDSKKRRHEFLNVTVTRPSVSSSTKSDKIEPNTVELSFTAAPDPYTHHSKMFADEGDVAYDKWYDEVQLPTDTNAAGSTATTPTAPASSATE